MVRPMRGVHGSGSLRRAAGLGTSAVLLALHLGCWPGTPPWSERGEASHLRLEVRNNQFLDVVIYAVPDGARERLGQVTGKSSGRLRIPSRLAFTGVGFQLLVTPLGSTATYRTEPIYVSPGDEVVLEVASTIRMSSWYVR